MKNLNFGCRRSEFLITTSSGDHFVQCRFYEPDREKPFTYRRRVNSLEHGKTQALKLLKREMQRLLDEKDYNPRTKTFMFATGQLSKEMYFEDALLLALKKKDCTPEHRKNVTSNLNKLHPIFLRLGYDYLKIKDVELPHVTAALEALKLSNYSYNKYRTHLSGLFSDLVNAGCLKINPCTGIKSKKHVKTAKETFTDEELETIAKHLKAEHPYFYNFFQIFYYSGCRVSEMLAIQKTDVDLERQEFTVIVKKGGAYQREQRAIIPAALPYWRSQLENALFDDDFIFGYHYQPGSEKLHRDSVYKFWKYKVMAMLSMEGTIYLLKHTFLDKLDAAQYDAQFAAGHRHAATTAIYTLNAKKRKLEAQKLVKIS